MSNESVGKHPKSPLAIVTMVYNEAHFLPIWSQYYGKSVGAECCYIVDHGSEPGMVAALAEGANVVRIPRSPFDEEARAEFISEFCSSLLKWYDAVIYTDADEFLVPDPLKYSSLVDFSINARPNVVTAIGLNVQHLPTFEAPLVSDQPVLMQRQWVRFAYPMCKPLFTRVPIRWTPGFHFSKHDTEFDRLFLFHLNYYDTDVALARLARNRSMEWQTLNYSGHQRVSDDQLATMIRRIAELPKFENVEFDGSNAQFEKYIDKAVEVTSRDKSIKSALGKHCEFDCAELFRIPERFRETIAI